MTGHAIDSRVAEPATVLLLPDSITAEEYEAIRDALNRQYELGKKDGYDDAVRMIRKATHALKRGNQ